MNDHEKRCTLAMDQIRGGKTRFDWLEQTVASQRRLIRLLYLAIVVLAFGFAFVGYNLYWLMGHVHTLQRAIISLNARMP